MRSPQPPLPADLLLGPGSGVTRAVPRHQNQIRLDPAVAPLRDAAARPPALLSSAQGVPHGRGWGRLLTACQPCLPVFSLIQILSSFMQLYLFLMTDAHLKFFSCLFISLVAKGFKKVLLLL